MFVIDLVLYKPKTAFKNLSGSVDIWIKINKNDTKNRIVSRLRRKLNDPNITNIINLDKNNPDTYDYKNIIIRHVDRAELIKIIRNGITGIEMRGILLAREENKILLDDYKFMKTVLSDFGYAYKYMSDRLKK